MEVGMAFWPAKTLLSAVELGLFARLGGDAMTGAELQDALGLHRRANPDFFDTLRDKQSLAWLAGGRG